jgi:hypothetical protein
VFAEGNDVLYYLGDNYVNVLGCIDQHQFCNPSYPGFDGSSTGCTSLTSYQGAIDDLNNLPLGDFQQATAGRFVSALIFETLYYSVSGRGASALRASEMVYDLSQASLPNNQWTIEISNWFALILARLQQAVVEYATGPLDLPPGGIVQSPDTVSNRALCLSQKVQATNGYQNFSTLGVAIILVLGTAIILLGVVIDKVVGFSQKRLKRGDYGRLAWALDEKLQLQRMAYEGAGWGPWRRCNKSVPIKRNSAQLGRYISMGYENPSIVPFSSEDRLQRDQLVPKIEEVHGSDSAGTE